MGKRTKYNRIKDVLAEQGKTQAWLAQALGVEYLTIHRYVSNTRQPSLTRLFEIARVLKVSASDLLND